VESYLFYVRHDEPTGDEFMNEMFEGPIEGPVEGLAGALFDVLVIGAGTSGMPCAFSAVDAGSRVLLVDKSDHVGGTLTISGGHMSAAGTRLQERHEILGDSADTHYADIERISENTMRADISRKAVDLAPKMIDWLDAEGFEWHPATPRIVYGHEPYAFARTSYGVDEGRTMLAFLERQLAQRLPTGRLNVQLNTTLHSLILDPSGAVVGATLVAADGALVEVFAHAVVLATGGFSSNPELFAELEGAPLVSAGVTTSTGDGLLAARAIGAGLAGQGTYLPTFGGMPHPDDPGRVQWVDRPFLSASERDPWEIYVDRQGARFVAEDDPSIDNKERALVGIDEMTFWMVFDEQAVVGSTDIVQGWSASDMRARVNHRDGVVSANTIFGLAGLAGIDPDGLRATIDQYNAAVIADRPDPFGRVVRPAPILSPPFYALKNHAITLITFTGVDVTADLEVRRTDGTVIRGLYGLGELLGSGAYMGNSFCSGMLVGPCISFGRWLGHELARKREI
jgi:fumarate reductase flavoprotein subunit